MRKLFVRILITPIKFYQKWISPGLAPRCKYYPSCSQYAVDAISIHGIKGVFMAGWRLLRCNPWSHGGVDYVPLKKPVTILNEQPHVEGVR
jgi:putative membrane protein insertion efficiency factor